VAEPNYVLRLVDPNDRVNKLRLRHADGALGAFLQRSCLPYHNGCVARTYVFVDDNEASPRRVVAYITILASEVGRENAATPDIPDFRFPTYPAIKIARLAVDERAQRRGLGRQLVAYSIALAKREIMSRIGCRFVIVDANQPAIEFYRRCGFVLVDTDDNKNLDTPVMFYDLLKV